MKTGTKFTIAFLCFTFLSVLSVDAQNSFFLNKPGMEAEYVVKDAKGNIQSYTKSVVTDVKKKDDKNYTITYTAEVFDKNKKSLAPATTVQMEVVNGVITYDPKAMMGEAGENVEVTGTFSSFPAELTVGQDLGDYSYTVKMSGMSTTTSGKSKVTAKEEISTDAGSFDCYKVESEVSTKVLVSTTKAKSTSWYAKNVGAVKTEIYDKKGKIQSTQELVALKK